MKPLRALPRTVPLSATLILCAGLASAAVPRAVDINGDGKIDADDAQAFLDAVAQGSARSPPPGPSCTTRTRPGRSVTKSRPSGAISTAQGARKPAATSCTFSTTAGPIRGDGVGVGLAVGGGAVVGIGMVVALGDEVAGRAVHEMSRSAMSTRTAAGPVPGWLRPQGPLPLGPRARLPVRSSGVAIGLPAARPVNGSRATRSPVPPAAG